ncbi:MAG TPA: efflux RND transporter periplasmic adaptor subunit [Planctomycetaceae bacterium]|jgi:cobalt-zinc-cadmium efflux system membrane fusion protein
MRFVQPAFKTLVTIGIFGVVLLIPLKVVPMVHQWLEDREAAGKMHAAEVYAEKMHELVSDEADTLVVEPDVFKSLSITLSNVQPAVAPEPLKLDGQLYLLSNSMVHVHSRFPGDVVEVGDYEDPNLARLRAANGNRSGDDAAETGGPQATDPGTETPSRPENYKRHLEFGDFVREGQLLAVVWSKELGEKKSELVEAVARLRIDEERLRVLEEGERKGAVPHDKVREQQKLVEGDAVNVDTAERTLHSWRVSDDEIESVRAEAERIRHRNLARAVRLNDNWARVEVRAVVSGTIVEKNVAVGDYVNNDLDLFKIADLSRMNVLANAYEEDLPALEGIPPAQRNWKIRLKADPKEEMAGSFDRIGPIIDPTQHTALVMGWVVNPRGRLRSGQFITAYIKLPTQPDEVSIPVSALVDQEGKTYVFSQSKKDPRRFQRRRVFPVRRNDQVVSLSRAPRTGSIDEVSEPLSVGDVVVTTGGLQLAAELTYLQSQAHIAGQGEPR